MIDKFEMFIALAREQHFGRAAEACHVSQPTLSSAIRSLEEHYGLPLVMRGARYMGLTSEGEQLLRRARVIVAEARAIHADLKADNGPLEGELRIGVIPTALTLVYAIAAPCMARHPGLRLDIRAMRAQGLLEAMADFRIDLGIGYSHNEQGLGPTGGFETLSLYRESWAVLARSAALPGALAGLAGQPSAALAADPAAGWAALAGLRLGLLSPDLQNRHILDQLLAARGLQVTPVVTASSTLALTSLLMSGAIEATVLPVHPAQFWAQMPGITCLPLCGEGAVITPDVALILPPEGRRNRLVSEFVRAARETRFPDPQD